MKKLLFSIVSNLQTHYHIKLDLKKSGRTYRRQVVNHGTRLRKDNQLQSMELPYTIPL